MELTIDPLCEEHSDYTRYMGWNKVLHRVTKYAQNIVEAYKVMTVPTKKPRVAITLSEAEKMMVKRIADRFGMSEAALCSYCVRRFLADFDGEPLQPISDGMQKQLPLEMGK